MWYYRALHRHIVRSVKPRSSAMELKLLDAGCGTGGLLRRLGEAYPAWRCTGLDLSTVACDQARERTRAEVIHGSVAALPFADAIFDVAVSCDVLCQVSDAGLAALEIYRCLKPGGIVVITMPAYQWMYSYHDREVANLRRYSRREVNALLSDVGFAVVASTYWNLLPFPLAVLRRKILPPVKSGSDVRLFSTPVEAAFNAMMALEHGWLAAGGRLPFGSSVLTVARKPAHDAGSPTP